MPWLLAAQAATTVEERRRHMLWRTRVRCNRAAIKNYNWDHKKCLKKSVKNNKADTIKINS